MSTKSQNKKTSASDTIFLKDAEYGLIRTSYIDFSPLNYRKYFSEEALQEFAECPGQNKRGNCYQYYTGDKNNFYSFYDFVTHACCIYRVQKVINYYHKVTFPGLIVTYRVFINLYELAL